MSFVSWLSKISFFQTFFLQILNLENPFREVEFVIMQTFVYNVNEFYIKKPPQVLA